MRLSLSFVALLGLATACASAAATKETAAEATAKAEAKRKATATKIDENQWKDMLISAREITILEQDIKLAQINLENRKKMMSEASNRMRADYDIKPEDKITDTGDIDRVSKSAKKP